MYISSILDGSISLGSISVSKIVLYTSYLLLCLKLCYTQVICINQIILKIYLKICSCIVKSEDSDR